MLINCTSLVSFAGGENVQSSGSGLNVNFTLRNVPKQGHHYRAHVASVTHTARIKSGPLRAINHFTADRQSERSSQQRTSSSRGPASPAAVDSGEQCRARPLPFPHLDCGKQRHLKPLRAPPPPYHCVMGRPDGLQQAAPPGTLAPHPGVRTTVWMRQCRPWTSCPPRSFRDRLVDPIGYGHQSTCNSATTWSSLPTIAVEQRHNELGVKLPKRSDVCVMEASLQRVL